MSFLGMQLASLAAEWVAQFSSVYGQLHVDERHTHPDSTTSGITEFSKINSSTRHMVCAAS